jgi:hypothetical protein
MGRSLTCALEHSLCPPIHKGPQPKRPTAGPLLCALSGIGECDFFNPKPGGRTPDLNHLVEGPLANNVNPEGENLFFIDIMYKGDYKEHPNAYRENFHIYHMGQVY